MRTRLAQRGSLTPSRGKLTATVYVPVRIKCKPQTDIRELRDDINDLGSRIGCATHTVEVAPRVTLKQLRLALTGKESE